MNNIENVTTITPMQMAEINRCMNNPLYMFNAYIKERFTTNATLEEYDRAANQFMAKEFTKKHKLEVKLVA